MIRLAKNNIPRCFALGAVLLSIVFAFPDKIFADKKTTDLMGQALKLRASGQLDRAVKLLEEAIGNTRNDTQQSLALFMLGDCLLESGKSRKARGVYQILLKSDLTNDEQAEARYRLAQCFDRLGSPQGARRLCREIIQKYGESPYVQLARLLMKSTDARSAISSPESPVYNAEPENTPAFAKVLTQSAETKVLQQTPRPAPAPPEAGTKPASRRRSLSPAVKTRGEDAVVSAEDSLPDEDPASEEIRDEPVDAASVDGPPGSFQPERYSETPDETPDKALSQAQQKSAVVAESVPARSAVLPKSLPKNRPISATPPAGATTKDLFDFGVLSLRQREALATKILQAQETLERNPHAPENDRILFTMASDTARFGEYIESCKLYDKLLSKFPSSPFVERAYFEAIRLRAYLKVYNAAIEWGGMFARTFPKSSFLPQVNRIVELSGRNNSNAKGVAMGLPSKNAGAEKLSDPENDPTYKEAKRKMEAGRYALAQRDFMALLKKYPGSPHVHWNLALVQVQQEEYSMAEKTLDRLLEIDSENPDARSLLGYVHYQKKDFKKAADAYGKAGGAPSNDGLNFFDSQNAANRLKLKKNQPARTAGKIPEGEEP